MRPFHSVPADVRLNQVLREARILIAGRSMSRSRSFRSLLLAALLCGAFAGRAAAEPIDQPPPPSDLIEADANGTSDSAPPAQGLTAVATEVELDLRGVRVGTFVSTARVQQSRPQRPWLWWTRTTPRDSADIAVRDRLLRGGIHSSSLGTPPPQS
jgi:hypothetical protein